MRPIFVGNFEYETRQSELERLFSKYGRVERVDMKNGFAFVYFEDERDAADAIRGLDNIPFGYDRRKLSVEWAKGERGRHRDGSRSMANQRPTKTLFVINFDPIRTRVRDIERHFEPYGKILNVRIRRNFAFVQFETQEEATKALECTNMSKILDRVVSVEYALKDDSERDDRYESPRRGGYGRRGDSPYKRSSSPPYRRRPSPDYGRPRSPVYDRYNGPAYDTRRSPEYGRFRSRSPIRRWWCCLNTILGGSGAPTLIRGICHFLMKCLVKPFFCILHHAGAKSHHQDAKLSLVECSISIKVSFFNHCLCLVHAHSLHS